MALEFSFDGKNPKAQSFAERWAARRITAIVESIRETIRSLIVVGIREGVSPYDTARTIRQFIGLNEQQAEAALGYRRRLVESGLSPTKVEQAMGKYVKQKVRYRAMVISRHETMEALNKGSLFSMKQAKQQGYLDSGSTKTVVTAPDERRCPICGKLEGETRDLDEPFSTGQMSPPFHVVCRCTMVVNP